MSRGVRFALAGAVALVLSGQAYAAVGVSLSTATPSTAGDNQFNTDNTGPAIQQDFTDNGHTSNGGFGAPGQSFTTPSGSITGYTLTSISVQVNLANSGNFGTFFSNGGKWGLQVSTFDNTASGGYGGRTDNNGTPFSAGYTAASAAFPANAAISSGTTGNDASAPASIQFKTLTSGAYDTTQGNPWVTFSFTGGDALSLLPNTTYSFDVYASSAVDGSGTSTFLDLFRAGSTDYSGGIAYNSFASRENFNDDFVANSGVGDRTFVVGLTAAGAAPEPASLVCLATGTLGMLVRRRRA